VLGVNTRPHWWLLLLVVVSGCVPFAWVLPPVDVASSVGPRSTGATVQPQVDLQVGVRPLAWLQSKHQRDNDFSLGYVMLLTPEPWVHGPYAELSHVFLEVNTSETHLWRLRGGPVFRLLYEPSVNRFGGQVVGRVLFESSSWVDSDFENADGRGVVLGHALGEFGLGLYLEGGVLAVPTTTGWSVSAGLIVSLPASAGVGFAWAL
jgi:hypothetical protein